MLTVVTWLWGDKYGAADMRRLQIGLARYLSLPHCFVCMTDRVHPDIGCAITMDDQERALCQTRGCFARLKMFDRAWQCSIGVNEGDHLACIDLDIVITGSLDPIFACADDFAILQGANAANPCPYNGSIFMLRAGYRPDVWSDFSLEAAGRVPFYEFPDDQGWLAHKLLGAANWQVGAASGIYAFHKPGWPKGDVLPADARLVVFPGARDPRQFTHLPWIKERWAA